MKGIIASLITPLKFDQSFDQQSMEKLIDNTIKNDIKGIFILGSIGERPCFSIRERETIIESTVKYVKDRVPVFIGIGKNSTSETIEFVTQAEKLKADYAVISPPIWRDHLISDDGLYSHFVDIADFSDIPLILYNIPSETKPISYNIIKKLKNVKNIVGIKDSSGDINFSLLFLKEIQTFQGDEKILFDSFIAGIECGISGMACIYPQRIVNIYNNSLDNHKRAKKYQKEVTRKIDYLMSFNNPLAAEKYILKLQGMCDEYVNSPFSNLSDIEKLDIEKKLNKWN